MPPGPGFSSTRTFRPLGDRDLEREPPRDLDLDRRSCPPGTLDRWSCTYFDPPCARSCSSTARPSTLVRFSSLSQCMRLSKNTLGLPVFDLMCSSRIMMSRELLSSFGRNRSCARGWPIQLGRSTSRGPLSRARSSEICEGLRAACIRCWSRLLSLLLYWSLFPPRRSCALSYGCKPVLGGTRSRSLERERLRLYELLWLLLPLWERARNLAPVFFFLSATLDLEADAEELLLCFEACFTARFWSRERGLLLSASGFCGEFPLAPGAGGQPPRPFTPGADIFSAAALLLLELEDELEEITAAGPAFNAAAAWCWCATLWLCQPDESDCSSFCFDSIRRCFSPSRRLPSFFDANFSGVPPTPPDFFEESMISLSSVFTIGAHAAAAAGAGAALSVRIYSMSFCMRTESSCCAFIISAILCSWAAFITAICHSLLARCWFMLSKSSFMLSSTTATFYGSGAAAIAPPEAIVDFSSAAVSARATWPCLHAFDCSTSRLGDPLLVYLLLSLELLFGQLPDPSDERLGVRCFGSAAAAAPCPWLFEPEFDDDTLECFSAASHAAFLSLTLRPAAAAAAFASISLRSVAELVSSQGGRRCGVRERSRDAELPDEDELSERDPAPALPRFILWSF